MGYWFHEKGVNLAGVDLGRGARKDWSRTPREILQRIRHGECKRVGHDAEFGWETPGRLPVDLNQHRGGIDGDTLQGSGFAELHVARAAQLARPDQGHIGEVAPGASRGHEGEFEFRPLQTGLGGDFERPAIVFRASHDHKRGVNRTIAHGRSETRESVARQLLKAFLPVGNDSRAMLEFRDGQPPQERRPRRLLPG